VELGIGYLELLPFQRLLILEIQEVIRLVGIRVVVEVVPEVLGQLLLERELLE
jgi:hypothetical protein